MKKMLRSKKGFSLVELLIALLIMAVIAAVAISLFGGVLGTSKVSADTQAAENIKRQILTYLNQTNDTNFSMLNVGPGTTGDMLVDTLGCIIAPNGGNPAASVITPPLAADQPTGFLVPVVAAGVIGTGDLAASCGPYLETSKLIRPQQFTADSHWQISITISNQKVEVTPVQNAAAPLLVVN